VARTGVGKVQAALLTQHLVDTYRPDRIVMVGVAGALDERLEVGDLVIATGTLQHDMDVTTLGFAPGAIPYTSYREIPCDPDLVARAGALVAAGDESIYSGLVVSGDQFIDDLARRAELARTHGALCVEMEGAAVGLVAQVNRIPFCLLRVISDHADGKAANFEDVLDLAADRALYYLSQMIFTGRDEDVPRSSE
jgi:adenosylhomocysteine nucleosidase